MDQCSSWKTCFDTFDSFLPDVRQRNQVVITLMHLFRCHPFVKPLFWSTPPHSTSPLLLSGGWRAPSKPGAAGEHSLCDHGAGQGRTDSRPARSDPG